MNCVKILHARAAKPSRLWMVPPVQMGLGVKRESVYPTAGRPGLQVSEFFFIINPMQSFKIDTFIDDDKHNPNYELILSESCIYGDYKGEIEVTPFTYKVCKDIVKDEPNRCLANYKRKCCMSCIFNETRNRGDNVK